MQPLISYFGGKQALAPIIAGMIEPGRFEVYCEPFAGGASVFFAAPGRWAKVEILNDLNGHLCNFYRVMQNPGHRQALFDLLDLTPHSREIWKQAKTLYDDDDLDPIWKAWAFYVGHQQSFNAARHSWRVPARHRDCADNWRQAVERLRVSAFIDRLLQASIENKSFEKIMVAFDSPRTLFYIDPPYIGANDQASMKRAYSGFVLSDDQDKLLVKLCAESKAGIILSGYPRDDLPGHWEKVKIETSVKADYNKDDEIHTQRRAIETIWINPQAQLQPRLI